MDFRELITLYIDPYFSVIDDEDEDPQGKLEAAFGGRDAAPGTFEAYGTGESKLDTSLPLDRAFLIYTPFDVELPGLAQVAHDMVTCVFFVENAKQPTITSDGEVTITDVVDVTYDFLN